MAKNWTCPYCNRQCTIGKDDIRMMTSNSFISAEYGDNESEVIIVVCPNPECRERTISMAIYKRARSPIAGSSPRRGEQLFLWNLLPESSARPFPDYIPQQLRDDYTEACLIKDKSPKASATLSRRCLQGIIRDFWDITKGKLVKEIDQIKDKVDLLTWSAIDAVRSVGNIGAHMEKDVNLIIDVEPEEAELLIGLIETLFDEWYIAKHDREEKMKALTELAAKKKADKKAAKESPPEPTIK